jgi:putative phosphoribosyl transferase
MPPRVYDERFGDRRDAGRRLAERLTAYAGRDDVVVLGLARGGVPVALEVATALGAPLDVLVVRKLGVPGHEELAMGAIAPGGARVMNPDVVQLAAIAPQTVEAVAARELRELERREGAYRGARAALDLSAKCVLLVDDGIATGASMRAAVAAARAAGAGRVVVATPTASREAVAVLAAEADDVVAVRVPAWFGAVGEAYSDFGQVGDDEVRRALASAPA